jgi:hypothetical protein
MAIKLPQETGFYWARTEKKFGWYNIIVHVIGDAPFFTMTGWLLSSLNENEAVPIKVYQIYEFGPKISVPEISQSGGKS